jgi:hypothetical protein
MKTDRTVKILLVDCELVKSCNLMTVEFLCLEQMKLVFSDAVPTATRQISVVISSAAESHFFTRHSDFLKLCTKPTLGATAPSLFMTLKVTTKFC